MIASRFCAVQNEAIRLDAGHGRKPGILPRDPRRESQILMIIGFSRMGARRTVFEASTGFPLAFHAEFAETTG